MIRVPPPAAYPWGPLSAPTPAKRKAFVSYHHGSDDLPGDQAWADSFRDLFCEAYEVLYDKSLRDEVDSRNPTYVDRVIREDYIVGSSITIVLCGAHSWRRKYVDWEIYATLHHKHALLGIALPTALREPDGIRTPDRFFDNWKSGYAHWLGHWTNDPNEIKSAVETALNMAKQTSRICNSRLKMERNV